MGRLRVLGLLIPLGLAVYLVQGTAGLEEVGELELEWCFNTSNQFQDTLFGAGHQGPMTVWDTDGDGINEILFGTRRGDSRRLWCIEGDGEFQWLYPPLNQEPLPGDPTSKVSLVDVDNDEIFELCLAGRGGRLHVVKADGSVLWTWDNPNNGTAMHGAPQAVDVDGDGFVEFFMNDDAGFIHRVDHQGNRVWTSSRTGGANQGHPAVWDIDRDGVYEVVWGCQDHFVYCADARDGTLKWRYDVGGNIKSQPPFIADVNDDDEYEVLVWGDAPLSGVVCLTFYGKAIWRWQHPRGINIRMAQAFGDIDDDGKMEMVMMTGDSGIAITISGDVARTKWDTNFTVWSMVGLLPPGAMADQWSSYQTIADFDADGRQEIIWLAPYPIVTDAATGQPEAYYTNDHVRGYTRQENGGWWGDVDKDGVSEFVCELNGPSHRETQIYCLTMGGEFPAKAAWPEFYHSAYPAEYQQDQEWLMMKAAYSNAMCFPIGLPGTEPLALSLLVGALVFGKGLFRGPSPRSS